MRLGRVRNHLLLAVLTILSLSACGRDLSGPRFRAERALWNARRLEQGLQIRQDAPPSRDETGRVLKAYEKLLAENPVPGNTAAADTMIVHQIARIRALAEMGMIRMYGARGDSTELRQRLDQARRSYPWSLNLTLMFTLELLKDFTNRGDIDQALRLCREMASELPARTVDGSPVVPVQDAPVQAADMLLQSGRRDEALAELGQAEFFYRDIIDKSPDDAASTLAWIQLGGVATRRGEFDKTASYLERARTSPGAAEMQSRILYLIGTLQQEGRGDLPAAVAAFGELAEEYPDDPITPEALVRRAACLAGLKQPEDALAVLAYLEEKYANDKANIARGRLLAARIEARNGHWAEALSHYRSLQADLPTSPEALGAPVEMAQHYAETGEPDVARTVLVRALEEYDRIAREKPGTMGARLADERQVGVLIQLERWSEAADKLLAMTSQYPQDPRNPLLMINAAGLVKDRLGDKARAAEILERVATSYPKSPLAEKAREEAERLRGQ